MVDDIDDLDRPVAAVVHQVVAAGARAPGGLGGPRRARALGPPAPRWDEVVTTIELEPLDRDDADGVVEDLLGGPVDARSLEWVWAAARGHPGWIVALLGATRAAGAWEGRAGLWSLSEDEALVPDRDLVARLDGLAPEVRAVLEVLALVGSIPIEVAESLGGPGPLVAAERAGLVRTEEDADGGLWCAVPSRIVAAALRARMDRPTEVARWDTAAEATARADQRVPALALVRGLALVGAERAGPEAAAEDLDAVLAGAVAAYTLSRWEDCVALAGVGVADPPRRPVPDLAHPRPRDAGRPRRHPRPVRRGARGRCRPRVPGPPRHDHRGEPVPLRRPGRGLRHHGPGPGRQPAPRPSGGLDVFESRLRSFGGDQDTALALVAPVVHGGVPPRRPRGDPAASPSRSRSRPRAAGRGPDRPASVAALRVTWPRPWPASTRPSPWP